ncbi:hypothetical protein ACET1N_27095 (plasmid) [Escherichia coli]|uniref:hypothetical protein n=1 Tax=Escherichia coli TaxID=562 RepID=UPI0035A63895
MRQVLNINVGLGSDIPAGHSPSIFEACLHAITASKALNDGGNSQLSSEVWGYSGASVSFREAFWLATGGDGKILDLPIGKLRKDYFVDTIAYFHERRSLNNFHRDRVITFEQIAE